MPLGCELASESLLEMPGFDPFPRRDLGFDYLCMTRPLVEFVARRFVEQQKQYRTEIALPRYSFIGIARPARGYGGSL